ncbi:MAG: DUF2892 domain-containing protein [Myxococcales bacterium]|nr:DUF2892 domain-containing protein [Myxococcales bacterium]
MSALTKILPRNEHPIERVLRVVLGIGLLLLVVLGPKTLWGLVGIVPLLTGLVGSCPIYTLLGISTCRTRDHAPST